MKKIWIVSLVIGVVLILVSCQNDKPKYTLKPTEDAEVKYLDGGWVATWADEFNGDKLDTNKWNYEIGTGQWGWGNNEAQYYTYLNHEVSDGTLKIEARHEEKNNSDYTSTRLTTQNKGEFTYGRIQVSAKLPKGRGLWPAIWMMPSESKFGAWPRSGEIDIMEYVGFQSEITHSALHTEIHNGSNGKNHKGELEYPELEDKFQLFELIWEPGVITTYINEFEVLKYVYTPHFNAEYEAHQVFPFYEDFFLILNLAIGGNWGGQQGIDNSIFPQIFEIDYVRVYQRDYVMLDKEVPQAPLGTRASTQLKNSIYWNASVDDYAISEYEVYVDGTLYGKSKLNQITLKNLKPNQSYDIQVLAIDMANKKSELSQSFNYTFKA